MFDSSQHRNMVEPSGAGLGILGSPRRESLTERLQRERTGLKERLTQLDTAIAALERNPEIQEEFDIVSRLV